jgi:hypothetical protein
VNGSLEPVVVESASSTISRKRKRLTISESELNHLRRIDASASAIPSSRRTRRSIPVDESDLEVSTQAFRESLIVETPPQDTNRAIASPQPEDLKDIVQERIKAAKGEIAKLKGEIQGEVEKLNHFRTVRAAIIEKETTKLDRYKRQLEALENLEVAAVKQEF